VPGSSSIRSRRRREREWLHYNGAGPIPSACPDAAVFLFRPMILHRLISEILFGFTGLMGILNPFGIAFLFLERTDSLNERQRAALARKVAINAFIVLMVAFFFGTPVLHFFGISMEALRIGGGFAVAVSGWQMLNAPDVPGGEAEVKPLNPHNVMARAFFPLTIPLTVGPGSVATAIALNANRTHKLSEFLMSSIVSVAVSALAALVIWQTYSRAEVLARYLGAEGTKVAQRVSAFLLLCVGVQIMLTGFSAFLQPLADQAK
jgi:multiple antibiotic resistance protein